MRAAIRLLASVQRSSQFLEAGAPTGITGLLTHASPRSTLLYTYATTLEKLKQFPENSVYRQSVEALTKHRMNIIESVQPGGLQEWQSRVLPTVDANPKAFRKIPVLDSSAQKGFNVVWKPYVTEGMKTEEWDDETVTKPELEGPRYEEERRDQGRKLARDVVAERDSIPQIEPEPALTVNQINDVESQIGAGLIEEVIQVAEGELHLVGVLAKDRV